MKCLRCGRDSEEKSSFCTECAQTVKEPLRESSYLNTQIVLPTRKEQPIVKKAEPKKERKRRPWGWMVSTVLLGLVCMALLLQGAFYAYGKARLRTELDRAQNAVVQEQEDLEFLKHQVVFIQNDNSKCYHRYDCPLFTRQNYHAYAPLQAQKLGYEPCPVCP